MVTIASGAQCSKTISQKFLSSCFVFNNKYFLELKGLTFQMERAHKEASTVNENCPTQRHTTVNMFMAGCKREPLGFRKGTSHLRRSQIQRIRDQISFQKRQNNVSKMMKEMGVPV